ncbi:MULTISPECIES: maleylacetoacetate isomerase [Marinomonas]|uniref:Maleylpyruvate isomerase n=2 Tax=Marinomonas TaxID=28253 RepID=A0A366D419_9GAMM|nr:MULTISPECIES: maleylacetoacetate isomerase [Marinomonas]AEF55397.1 maleylacetoacetate isomerase [Marinomonas posidonica IVIA-Po-181]RBO84038.1 maleylpyruvate isomerase [Marinomonas aquiplantarum]
MQLYNFFNSSTSYRVRIALALKGLSYEHHGVNIRIGEQATESHIKLNPAKGVPVLITDDGQTLTQSMAILDYLELTYPDSPLLPKDTLERARVLEICHMIASDMHPVNNLRILGYLKQQLEVTDEQKTAWYQHWIQEGFEALESRLNEYGYGDYCFGDQATLADCCLVPQVANALRFGCDLSSFTKVLSIYEHCQQNTAFQQAAPNQQPDFIA